MKDLQPFLLLLMLLFPLWADNHEEEASLLEKELKELGAADFLISDYVPELDTIIDSISPDSATVDTVDTTTVVSDKRSGGPVGGSISSMGGGGRKHRKGHKGPTIAKSDSTKTDSTKTDTVTAVKSVALKEADIAEVSTIDINEGHKSYRSPQKALFMSLLVPGWGQAYSKSYWKTGFWAVMEVGLVAGYFKFKSDGSDKKDEAHNYADNNFSTQRLETFYTTVRQYGLDKYSSTPENTIVGLILPGHDSISTYMATVTADLYGEVGLANNVQGWSDATSYTYQLAEKTFFIGSQELPVTLRLAGDAPFGTSTMQRTYNSMIGESDDAYGTSQTFLLAIVVNHVVSAADAFITAYAYNQKYLKHEETILSRVSLDNSMELSYNGSPLTRVGLIWHF